MRPADNLAPMSWPTAVLFDFDGVLVHSEPLHHMAFCQVLAEEKIELSEEEYYRELVGFDDRGAIEHIYSRRNLRLDPKTLLRVLTRKTEATMELINGRKYQALPGVDEFVRGLWRHYPLAICSGAMREEIEAMLEGIGLRDCFPTIVAAQDVKHGKPNPEGYRLATKLVGKRIRKPLKPADCLVIEDAPTVCESVRAAGFKVLAVTNTYPAEKLRKANYIVPSLRPRVVAKKLPRLKMKI
jgi:beta-phosphoglucomutase